MFRYQIIVPVFVSFLLVGCMDKVFEEAEKNANKNPEDKILRKTTQEIEKFDPNANIEVSENGTEMSNTGTPLDVVAPALSKHFKGQVNYAIRLFHAEKGRYPKDYEEFMEVVVKQGQIKLPVLPGGWKYSYDEEAHELKVIRHLGKNDDKKEAAQKEEEKPKKNPAAKFLPGTQGVQGLR